MPCKARQVPRWGCQRYNGTCQGEPKPDYVAPCEVFRHIPCTVIHQSKQGRHCCRSITRSKSVWHRLPCQVGIFSVEAHDQSFQRGGQGREPRHESVCRHHQTLPSPSTQTAFEPCRSIGDNMLCYFEKVEYLQHAGQLGCMVCLDFSKASDRLRQP